MIYLWCKYVDVITYDGISWGEACNSCIQIYDMHEHVVRYFEINNDECSHDDMQDLACGLFSMILWWYS